MFTSSVRTKDQLVEVIEKVVRNRLLSCRFRDTSRIRRVMEDWSIPEMAIDPG